VRGGGVFAISLLRWRKIPLNRWFQITEQGQIVVVHRNTQRKPLFFVWSNQGSGSQHRSFLRRTCRAGSFGTWMIVDSMEVGISYSFPWLGGMVGLFAFEFIEGNTITRVYFMGLRRLTRSALDAGEVTPELQQAGASMCRHCVVPTHCLDLAHNQRTYTLHIRFWLAPRFALPRLAVPRTRQRSRQCLSSGDGSIALNGGDHD
jgi:hypothetical protein